MFSDFIDAVIGTMYIQVRERHSIYINTFFRMNRFYTCKLLFIIKFSKYLDLGKSESIYLYIKCNQKMKTTLWIGDT